MSSPTPTVRGVAPSDDPSTRGLTRVSPHVVERIASYACERVTGTITPRNAPRDVKAPTVKARADVSGPRAHLAVTVGMAYAQPVSTTAAGLRDAIKTDVERLCGMRVLAVDIEAVPVHTMRRSRVQ